jgi:SAM-dependent MidA family methyltransferase
MCHYRHRAHADPLILVGAQDITAHVDFTLVAESAEESALTVAGFTNQAAFLMNCGLLSLMNATVDEKARFLQNQQILQLTLPSEMGELFKVIGLTKNIDIKLLGFSAMNQLERL